MENLRASLLGFKVFQLRAFADSIADEGGKLVYNNPWGRIDGDKQLVYQCW